MDMTNQHGKNFAFHMGSTHKMKVLRKFIEEKWRAREDLSDRLDCINQLREISNVGDYPSYNIPALVTER